MGIITGRAPPPHDHRGVSRAEPKMRELLFFGGNRARHPRSSQGHPAPAVPGPDGTYVGQMALQAPISIPQKHGRYGLFYGPK